MCAGSWPRLREAMPDLAMSVLEEARGLEACGEREQREVTKAGGRWRNRQAGSPPSEGWGQAGR